MDIQGHGTVPAEYSIMTLSYLKYDTSLLRARCARQSRITDN